MANTRPNELLTACAYVEKGGVGKTTTIAHLGVALEREGCDVLAIDLAGKQGDLAKSFGVHDAVTADSWPNISTVFKPEWDQVVNAIGKEDILFAPTDADHDPLVVETGEGVDLIPAHQGLDSLDMELGNAYDGVSKYTQLTSFLDEHVAPAYDVCLLDLPGAPNNVTYNGVFAAENVIAPAQAGEFEATQVVSLAEDIQTIRKNFDQDVSLTLLLENRADSRTSLTLQTLLERIDDGVFEKAGVDREKIMDAIGPAAIPQSQDIVNAQAEGKTVFALEEPSPTAQRAIDAYEVTADELLNRIGGVEQEDMIRQ